MFAPLILPLQFTCVVVSFLVLCAFAYLIRRTKSRPKSAEWAIFVGLIVFVPTFIVVGSIVDTVRYGEFDFARGSEITDRYVEIPEAATNVTLHKYASGHALRFTVDEPTLLAWMDAVVKKHRKYTDRAVPFKIEESGAETIQFDWKQRFGRYGWSVPDEVVFYRGWRSARGGGFDVWYSPASQTAFIAAGYW